MILQRQPSTQSCRSLATGKNAKGDTPQGVLFIVTDGVDDAKDPASCSQPWSRSRCQEPFNLAQCTAIKNRNIRIAILYTEYLPLPTNGWYNQWISPFQSQIGSTLQAFARQMVCMPRFKRAAIFRRR